jgi:hypothetical protein
LEQPVPTGIFRVDILEMVALPAAGQVVVVADIIPTECPDHLVRPATANHSSTEAPAVTQASMTTVVTEAAAVDGTMEAMAAGAAVLRVEELTVCFLLIQAVEAEVLLTEVMGRSILQGSRQGTDR